MAMPILLERASRDLLTMMISKKMPPPKGVVLLGGVSSLNRCVLIGGSVSPWGRL